MEYTNHLFESYLIANMKVTLQPFLVKSFTK
jgi:hypothetical protein